MPQSSGRIVLSWQDAPWLKPVWQQLLQTEHRHAHALAIESQPGLGTEAMLQAYVAKRLCEGRERSDSSALACGSCPSCQWLAQHHHPDLRWVRPEALSLNESGEEIEADAKGKVAKPSNEIRIDQIRPLESFLQVASHRAGARIVWLEPAQTLNRPAANALLKMLEEPGDASLWILSTPRLSGLMPTIRSRCITVSVNPPPAKQAQAFLQQLLHEAACAKPHAAQYEPALLGLALGLSHHAPWRAKERLEAPLLAEQSRWLHALAQLPSGWFSQLASHWADCEALDWFELLERWVIDLLQARYLLDPIYFKAYAAAAQTRAGGLKLPQCFQIINRLLAMKSSLRHPLNPRLHAESALLHYAELVGQSG
ncbi:MAG: hypothetical protein EBZ06_00895 [Betaproteobacteria bacterium]|nr:hypothetical protein [Betaproteobacteria bacterium]NDA22870.1 hypothetical protein [Betaproteobacteria bacterium]NDH31637.1 hypothetical protein [Betaproteobacteria bacterium]